MSTPTTSELMERLESVGVSIDALQLKRADLESKVTLLEEKLAGLPAAQLAWMALRNNIGPQARIGFGNCIAVLDSFFARGDR